MADLDFNDITIRHKDTDERRTVARWSFEAGHWPNYERVDSQGRVVNTTPKKES